MGVHKSKSRLTILLTALVLLTLSAGAWAGEPSVVVKVGSDATATTVTKARFSQYRYFVQDPIAQKASGSKFEWEYCNWALNFTALIADFPVPDSTIRITVAVTSGTAVATADIGDTTGTVVLDGLFSDVGRPMGAHSHSLRLRSGKEDLSGKIAWSQSLVKGEAVKVLQGHVTGSTMKIVASRSEFDVFLPVDWPMIHDPDHNPPRPWTRGKVPAVGEVTLQIDPPQPAVVLGRAGSVGNLLPGTIHFTTELTSGTIRNNTSAGSVYNWQRIAVTTLPASLEKQPAGEN